MRLSFLKRHWMAWSLSGQLDAIKQALPLCRHQLVSGIGQGYWLDNEGSPLECHWLDDKKVSSECHRLDDEGLTPASQCYARIVAR